MKNAGLSASCHSISTRGNNEIVLIGVDLIVLHGDYDRDQLWLNFGHFIWLPPQPPEPPRAKDGYDAQILRRSRLYALLNVAYKRLYTFKEGIDQYMLPFPDQLKLSGFDIRRARGAGFPGFERNHGKVPAFKFTKADRNSLLAWCAQNCRHHYSISDDVAVFSKVRDAALAALVVEAIPCLVGKIKTDS